ncbi:antitoxin [Spirochaetia bacterium]|nr:antitoxin [Spirochaetia bacterium]
MPNTVTIGAFEAKTHFSELINEVQNGSDYVITKRGKPVAKVIPFIERRQTRQEAIAELRTSIQKHWQGPPLRPGEIKEMIEEGRE